MNERILDIALGAGAYSFLTWIYRKVYDATSGHVDALAAENRRYHTEVERLTLQNRALRKAIRDLGGEDTGDRDQVADRVAELVRTGNKVAAIRDYRRQTGASLKDAKEYIDKLADDLQA